MTLLDANALHSAGWRAICAALCALILAQLLGAGCASPDVPAELRTPELLPADREARVFRLGPNDIVRCGVHGHPELSTPTSDRFDGTRVDPDGHLSLGLVGSIPVAGLTLEEARARITEAYAQYLKEPRIEFSLLEHAARRFYVYGEVAAPGAYVIDRPLNVYQALTFGGGFKPTAKRDEVVLLREHEGGEVEVHVIDGEEIVSAGLMDVRPDDFLFVMRSGSGRFRDEALPILAGISSSLSSLATILLVEERLQD